MATVFSMLSFSLPSPLSPSALPLAQGKGASGFSSTSTAEEVTQGIDGTGLTAIVTGGSSGIGAETSRVFALRGIQVALAVRNTESGKKVKDAILKEKPDAKINVMKLDVSSMASVRKFAEEYKSSGLPLNLLINNAGIMATPFTLSQDNIETQFATNHLGHFLLTNLLLETMKNTSRKSNREGRIVNISSEGHMLSYKEGIRFDKINDKSSYKPWGAYGQSKLANILHANQLAKNFKEEGVEITANSLHPGIISTNLWSNFGFLNNVANWIGRNVLKNVLKDVHQGAATTCYVALHPQVKGISGKYFSDSNIAETNAMGKDEELAKKLWDFSLSLTESK